MATEKDDTETMESEQALVIVEDADSVSAANEDEKSPSAQNGERADTPSIIENTIRSRNNSSEQSKDEQDGGAAMRQAEEPPRKRFQIPRKSRDKKALQPVCSGSREFEEILNILHSSYLDSNSMAHFTYKSAQLLHNEFLEKEFTEKRRQLKFDGRLDKELADSYAFLLVDNEQVNTICERGLNVGHSRITSLGKPAMGVYLSRYADLLQANPLDPATTGSIFIFKVIKGKMKGIYYHMRNNQMDSSFGNGDLDPAPKHECHVFKNVNNVTSLLSYRAFERTQYYFYEYGFDEILKRPRHVCPYAVVSFGYKEEMTPRVQSSGSVPYISNRYSDRSSFTLWRGQLLNKGKLLCYASLRSTTGPFFPYKLPDKLNLETVMHIDQVKKNIPSALFRKDTHNHPGEVTMGGMYSRLYEVVEKTRTGNNLQNLLQKLDKEKLALVKPLADKGFLFLFFPSSMTSKYGLQSGKSCLLHALFIYPESRENLPLDCSKLSTVMQENKIMPELTSFIASLHSALHKSQSDTSADFNKVVEKHARIYLKRRAERPYKYKEYIPKPYESRLDNKKWLFLAPKDKSRINSALRNYIFGSEAYSLLVDKAKDIMKENQRFQQFSPVSDYEPIEDDEVTQTVNRKGQHETAEGVHEKVSAHADYDLEKLCGLINLIQSRKQNAFNTSETDDSSSGGVKRKLESSPENKWKHLKSEDGYYHPGELDENSRSMSSFITELGGKDTDLRRENTGQTVTETADYIKLFLATLADPSVNLSFAESINKALGIQSETMDEEPGQNIENVSPPEDTLTNNSEHDDLICYKKPQSVDPQDNSAVLLTQPPDGNLKTSDDVGDHPVCQETSSPEPRSKSASPCPSTPTENIYHRQFSSSSNTESEMHWKLIPITGLSPTEEQLVYVSPKDAYPNDPRILHRRRRSGYSPFQENKKGRNCILKQESEASMECISTSSNTEHDLFQTRHCHNGIIENTVLEVYSIFSERLYEVLKQKEITYLGKARTPFLSSSERVAKLSDWLYSKESDIPVQQYVQDLHEKLESVVNSYANSGDLDKPVNANPAEISQPESLSVQEEVPTSIASHTEMDATQKEHLPSVLYLNDHVELKSSNEVVHDLTKGNQTNNEELQPHKASDLQSETSEKATSDVTDLHFSASQTALTDLINQMHPEVFNNLVKIFTHVNKNIVKFYIHTEEENLICGEIKEYLLKLGNVECPPEEFLESNALSDKLLIIIQNEDIALCIHKIPVLVTLKRLACVSFAGVDSLDDLKNHTYNELFVSGGFIVSDETVLNPESVTLDKLQGFLKFLEEVDSPEGKWQWKIHCKFQKKLKELGRLNASALNMLTLLNTYQKKHLVEILSYHSCDSQTRQAPELECLIKLQVQNIQQRHVVFLTEKDASLFSNYSVNGIVITTMEDFMQNFTKLVGYHNSSTEDNCLSQLASQENENVPAEADVKEEEDMSIDSEDEIPQIEVCTDSLKCESHNEDSTIESVYVETAQTEGHTNLMQCKTPHIDSNEIQPVTPVLTTSSITGENSTLTGDSTNFQDYSSRQTSMSHQFSHFNVLTHQTFLGTMYPVLTNQPQGGNYFISQEMEPDLSQNSEWNQTWN
ncbi:protein TASOR isoform 2-T2 [Discoglossus pictus]